MPISPKEKYIQILRDKLGVVPRRRPDITIPERPQRPRPRERQRYPYNRYTRSPKTIY